MSASSSGRRSNQRSARLRMFRVATCRRSIGLPQLGRLGDRDRERERAAGSLRRFRPGSGRRAASDDVAGDGQAQTGPAALAADTRPVDLEEALEDPRLGRPRDADAVSATLMTTVRRPRRTRDRDGAATPGLNLTALWRRLTQELPEPARHRPGPAAAPAPGARPEVDPLPLGEQRAAGGCRVMGDPPPARARSSCVERLPLSMRDRSSSSLTIWTR